MAQASLGLFVMTAIDSFLLLAFVVVSVTLGKPLSLLNCFTIATADSKTDAAGAAYWLQSLVSDCILGLAPPDSTVLRLRQFGDCALRFGQFSYVFWFSDRVADSRASSILFSCSIILLPTLWFKSKRAGLLPKKIEAA
jgi:hypothetical protein